MGMKWFTADSSGMLIPKNTSLPLPLLLLILLQSGMLQQVIIGSRMERGRMKRMSERWSDKKDGEGDM